MDVEEETAVTEITIGPDGRLFVFGLSREVLEVLEGVCPQDRTLRQLAQLIVQQEEAGP